MKKLLYAVLILVALFGITTAEQWFLLPPGVQAQTNTFCASNLACTVTGIWTFSTAPIITALNVGNLNNTCFADQQTGADMGIKIAACAAALPSTGGVIDATGFQGAQVWSTNIFAAISKPVLIKLGPSQTSINVQQTPNTGQVRIVGLGGATNGGGNPICNTTLAKGFATGDLFAIGANGIGFKLASVCITAGVTLTSGFVVNPAPTAGQGYIQDVHLQNQYGGFKLFAGSAAGLNGWRIENLSWNCAPNTVHTGTFLSLGSTDNTVTSAGHIFTNWVSTGDLCIHDAPAFLIDSMVDSPSFSNMNFSISRANTSTQPNWVFQNTLGGGNPPRLVSMVGIYTEGDGIAGNDILKIAACNDCNFTNDDFGGGDHGVNISGGSGMTFNGGQITNNSNGGLYVTSSVTDLGLSVNGVNFYGNSVTTNNTTDDIQIAAGTTGYSIIGNLFGQITSTLTTNVARYMVNVLGTTTGGQYTVLGNQIKTSKFGTAFIRDPTVGATHTIQDANGNITYFTGASGTKLIFTDPAGTHTNFMWACQQNINNGCEITPSTAGGGQTFSTPALSISNNGVGGPGIVTVDTGGLVPRTAGSTDFGSTALPIANLWLGTAATNNLKLQPSAFAAARVMTISDPLGAVGLPYVIASGTTTLTANAALGAVTSQAANTTAAANVVATTDAIEWSYASAPGAGDSLCHISPYVTAGNVNFVRTNPTAAAQNVSAIIVNWRVVR